MIEFLQSLSLTSVILMLLGVMICIGLLQWIVRLKRFSFWFRSDEAVGSYVQMLTLFYGLLLGLVAVDVWQAQDAAEKNTTNEANQIRILADLASSLPGNTSVLIASLGDYTQGVVKKEWPMMLSEQQREMFVASPE